MPTVARSLTPLPQAAPGLTAADQQPAGEGLGQLLPSKCFLCDHDDAEPLAVGQDFTGRSGSETFLAVCCRGCGLVYLNPSPAPVSPERVDTRASDAEPEWRQLSVSGWQSSRSWAREITRLSRSLPERGRFLDAGPQDGERLDLLQRCLGAEWQIDRVDADLSSELDLPEDTYDGMLLLGAIERAGNPLVGLNRAKRLLRPGGLVVIVTPNTGSTVSRLFGGRHWSGYNFPRHLNLFNQQTLRLTAERADLEIVSVRTAPAAPVWVESVSTMMVDWEAPGWALNLLTRASTALLAIAKVVEWSQQLRGKGGMLLMTLRRSAG